MRLGVSLHRSSELLKAAVRPIARPLRRRLIGKERAEVAFWVRRHLTEHGRFRNDHYERIMLAIADEADSSFLTGKVVADFGCGPRGSLAWAEEAAVRIGIDVLADRYADAFPDDVAAHGMIYVKSSERSIPLPSAFVDVMFSLNAIDHVDDLSAMCSEIIRVMRPGGLLLGSFNLEERASLTEPQRLTERIIQDVLLSRLDVERYRVAPRAAGGETYEAFFTGAEPYIPGEQGYLWVRARKPTASGELAAR